MPWQSSSGPQIAVPEPVPAGGSDEGVGLVEALGALDAAAPEAPDAPPDALDVGVGVAGFRVAPVLLSELVPEEDLSLSDSVAPEHAATRQAKTTKPARAGSKRAFME